MRLAVEEKKDGPDGRPSSLTLGAGARYVVEKKNRGRIVEFTYLANDVEVGQRKSDSLAA